MLSTRYRISTRGRLPRPHFGISGSKFVTIATPQYTRYHRRIPMDLDLRMSFFMVCQIPATSTGPWDAGPQRLDIRQVPMLRRAIKEEVRIRPWTRRNCRPAQKGHACMGPDVDTTIYCGPLCKQRHCNLSKMQAPKGAIAYLLRHIRRLKYCPRYQIQIAGVLVSTLPEFHTST